MSPIFIYIGEPHAPTLRGMNVAGTFLNGLTATYTLKTDAGVAVADGAGPMPYVGGSDGDYIGSLLGPVTGTLEELKTYFLEMVYAGTVSGRRRLKLIARYREEF